MKQIVQIQHSAYQNKTHDNLASVLLSPHLPGSDASEDELEQELIKALKEKYDAVKDKIYEEALKAYVSIHVSIIMLMKFLFPIKK